MVRSLEHLKFGCFINNQKGREMYIIVRDQENEIIEKRKIKMETNSYNNCWILRGKSIKNGENLITFEISERILGSLKYKVLP